MRAADYVGKECIHDTLGRVRVDSAPPRSKVQVEITVLQRGRGWNNATETYEHFFIGSTLQEDGSRSLRWGFTNNDQYGHKDIVHINELKLIKS